MKARITVISCALLTLSGCAAGEYRDVPVTVESAKRCDIPGALGKEGYCHITGKTDSGELIAGEIFTMAEPGQQVVLRCGENWRCLPTARVLSP